MRASMTRRDFLRAALAGTAMAAAPLRGWAAENATRPNIILVFIDDMGWSDLSCFGNTDASTPNIDRLANEGIAFEQFYVNAPICSPSRVAISTGTYPQRWNITSYLAHREKNEKRGIANWLDPEAPMLARTLHEAGYATGHFGKWHMGGQRDVEDAPPISAYGFDASLTNFEGLGPKLLPATKKPDGTTGRIWQDAERLGGPVTWMQRSRITAGFIDAAIPFMDQAQQDGKPFYINLWPDDVHSPFWPPVDQWGDGSKRGRYLGVLEAMDAQLGKLFDYVRDNAGLRDNTLILLCSDNGPEKGAGRSEPLRGAKVQLYEGGIRSPLVVWGPGLMRDAARGTRNTESVFAAIDLVPSLLAITGVAPPKEADYDGEDLSQVLLGASKDSREAPIFFSRPPDRKDYKGSKNLPDLAVRDGHWKLACDYDGSRPELYNLAEDPSETRNLAQEHPERAQQLTARVTAWYRAVSGEARP